MHCYDATSAGTGLQLFENERSFSHSTEDTNINDEIQSSIASILPQSASISKGGAKRVKKDKITTKMMPSPQNFKFRNNARERKRTAMMGEAFTRLNSMVPSEPKRFTRMNTLKGAIEYINFLKDILGSDQTLKSQNENQPNGHTDSVNVKRDDDELNLEELLMVKDGENTDVYDLNNVNFDITNFSGPSNNNFNCSFDYYGLDTDIEDILMGCIKQEGNDFLF
ncbi:unnamed protein product [Gordionus sp. m RMFG-2023]